MDINTTPDPAVYNADRAKATEDELYNDSIKGTRLWFQAHLANNEIKRLTALLAAKESNDDACQAVVEAIDTLVSPGTSAWEVIASQVNHVVPYNSAAGKAFHRLVEAVDNYRRCYWPDEYPSENLEPENRDDALADIRMEEAREVSWGSR